jgi:peroxiredoxin
MRRSLSYVLVLLIISCSRTDTFKISGIIEEIDSAKIYLDEQEIESIQQLDSVKISKNGKFTLKGHTAYPRFYQLHLGSNRILPLLIGPGEKVFIRSTKQDFPYRYEIEGSEGSQYIKYLNDRLYITRKKLDSIQNLINNTVNDEIRQSELLDEYTRVIEEQRSFTLKFILEHLTSMASIYAIYQKLDNETYVLYKNRDVQILKITGAALDTIYPESVHVRSLVANAANLEQQIRAMDIQKLINEIEPSLPDIALPDPEGDTIHLSSLKGKVVLLSFWASWNKESTDYNPQLLELYNKYHGLGFEIYQVSLDNRREPWLQAIEYDELPWINVSDLSYPESVVAAVYNVTSLPMTYLINKQWDISGKNLSITELNRRIGSLLNQ